MPPSLRPRLAPQRWPSPICHQCLLNSFKRNVMIRTITTKSNSNESQSSLSQKTAEYIDTLQLRALAAGQKLNDFTGYSSIESLKQQIQKQEEIARAAREAVQKAKEDYSFAVTKRAETQRELTNLLNRKTSWTPDDLSRFTTLYPTDHENEALVTRTQQLLSEKERESEEASAELGRLILSRYHEEQIWSDKIRRASTWGTFALMGVNVVLFVIVQVGLEPWRRKRLVKGFEEKVRMVVEEAKLKDEETVRMDEEKESEETSDGAESAESLRNAEEEIEKVFEEDEEGIIPEVIGEDREVGIFDDLKQRKDIWVGAAGGAVIGSLLTALGTYLLSR